MDQDGELDIVRYAQGLDQQAAVLRNPGVLRRTSDANIDQSPMKHRTPRMKPAAKAYTPREGIASPQPNSTARNLPETRKSKEPAP
jgi:hypothetical protein